MAMPYGTDPSNGATSNAHRAPPPERPVNPSCFGTIEHNAEAIRQAASRVEHYVTRLCGGIPTPGELAGASKGAPNGLMEEATSHALVVGESAERINAALDRLERSLP